VNGEMEEAVIVYFKVFPMHFSEKKLKKIRIKFNQDRRALGQQSNLNLPKTEY
jgi:benzoyl-CoA reductase/2-hydroxyglutaryl-CoA dehydratase subunit BcrC/BadD/HgdB